MAMRHSDILARHLAAVGLALVAASCTVDVELCTGAYHPHSAEVSYNFAFDTDADVPDSMFVVANRVVARRMAIMKVGTADGKGSFLLGEMEEPPATQQPGDGTAGGDETPGANPGGGEGGAPDGGEAQPDGGVSPQWARFVAQAVGDGTQAGSAESGGDAPDGGTEGGGAQGGGSGSDADEGPLTWFRVPVGSYRFLTFNMDTTEFIYDDVLQYISGDDSMSMGDLYLEYRVYAKDEPGLRETIPGWQDYNPYAGYIQPDICAFCVATTTTELASGQRFRCNFRPDLVSQNVDVYFNIQKARGSAPFAIDSVVAEISGLPYRMNIVNGYLDISRTNKMMFRMGFVGGSDSYSTQAVRCHANINIPGIVPGASTDVNTGPGIMQVIIYASAANPDDPDGRPLTKKIQGKINLYNTLREARLTDYTDDFKFVKRTSAHGTLDIKADLVIDGNQILESPDNDGGIDSWIGCDSDFEVDI